MDGEFKNNKNRITKQKKKKTRIFEEEKKLKFTDSE